eukprot:m.36599 g.36599  ORF g.36599 m.36599 type:complete len:789 (-) comp17403_c0_seq2:198-2564(-)
MLHKSPNTGLLLSTLLMVCVKSAVGFGWGLLSVAISTANEPSGGQCEQFHLLCPHMEAQCTHCVDQENNRHRATHTTPTTTTTTATTTTTVTTTTTTMPIVRPPTTALPSAFPTVAVQFFPQTTAAPWFPDEDSSSCETEQDCTRCCEVSQFWCSVSDCEQALTNMPHSNRTYSGIFQTLIEPICENGMNDPQLLYSTVAMCNNLTYCQQQVYPCLMHSECARYVLEYEFAESGTSSLLKLFNATFSATTVVQEFIEPMFEACDPFADCAPSFNACVNDEACAECIGHGYCGNLDPPSDAFDMFVAVIKNCETQTSTDVGGQSNSASSSGLPSAPDSSNNSMCISMWSACKFIPECDECVTSISCAFDSLNENKKYLQGMFEACELLQCPDWVATSNHTVYATIVFGSISLIGCLCVIAVIYGYSRDRKSLRSRILLGMFIFNALFSIANVTGYRLYSEQGHLQNCIRPAGSLSSRCFGHALWMSGKFGMVCYEMFMVVTSIVALRISSINIDPVHERLAHGSCVCVALLTFFTFISLCEQHSPTVKQFDPVITNNTVSFIHYGTNLVDDLIRGMIVAWIPIFGLVLMLWGYQRVVLVKVMRDWKHGFDRVVHMNASGLVHESLQHSANQVVLKQREAYMEIAKPLEPYIAVFICFSVPAVVMATDFCIHETFSPSEVACDCVCDMLLSIRSAATVAVFFRDATNRAQLFHFSKLLRKVWVRFCGFVSFCRTCAGGDVKDRSKVGFRKNVATVHVLDDIRQSMIEDDSAIDSMSYSLMTDADGGTDDL